eukprot:CAMPEP_0183359098 /NCGR_PEP_ID=MMETSP0164_2-20130417/51204_1 /TAXON_ID=221442 /ORGANISM="Coccolithus pelagicus ssp braarudi, Strain PLY182g" /LENGTH=406 /DNA_ID=CAMNT_0025533137 /DNA_START=80 /DNA_END=1300 /DNA_ORIENTATION=-
MLVSITPCVVLGLLAGSPPPRRFQAADFADFFERRSVTAQAYAGAPLADDPGYLRNKVITVVMRQLEAEWHPCAAIEEAEPGFGEDGRLRAQNQAPYSWKRNGRRVKCKTARLSWSPGNQRWKLQFSRVQMGVDGVKAEFDELLLVSYTPRGLYVHRHDGRLGVSTSGKTTAVRGGEIAVAGPVGETDWASALDCTVLPKLEERGCKRLAFLPFEDPRVGAARALHPPTTTAAVFKGALLASCSGPARGRVLSSVARRIDAMLHPGATIEEADPRLDFHGRLRAQNQAPYSWKRDGRRVACKTAGLSWNAHMRCWKLQFQNVVLGGDGVEVAFDELLLVTYTPRGLYVHRHDGWFGVTTNGKATALTGHRIEVSGPRDELDWASALDRAMLPRIESGCECLAVVRW